MKKDNSDEHINSVERKLKDDNSEKDHSGKGFSEKGKLKKDSSENIITEKGNSEKEQTEKGQSMKMTVPEKGQF